MLMIPRTVGRHEYDMFVILQDDNVERIRAYDPAIVDMNKIPTGITTGRRLRAVLVCYATQAEVDELLAKDADVPKLLVKLGRGFQFKPEAGDHDGPYERVDPESRKGGN